MRIPFRKDESLVIRVLKSDELTGYVVRRAAIGVLAVLALINLPDMVRYLKIELM